MHELITHDWLDHDYIAQHTLGWEHADAPAMAARACGRRVRRAGAADPRPGARLRLRRSRLRHSPELRHAARARRQQRSPAPSATGAGGRLARSRPGGLLLSASGQFPVDRAALQRRAPWPGAGRAPSTWCASAIRCWATRMRSRAARRSRRSSSTTATPLRWRPSRPRWRPASRANLFTVVLEQFQTDTADYADYLLPATTQLEHWDIHTSYGHTDVLLNRPAVAPRGEARSNAWVFRELARRMGFDDPCFQDDDEALCRQAFAWRHRLGRARVARLRQRALARGALCERGLSHALGPGRVLQRTAGRAGPGRPARPPAQPQPSGSSADYPLAMISPPARNFNSSFVNVRACAPSRASRCWRSRRRRRCARHRRRGHGARVQRPRRSTAAAPDRSRRAAGASCTGWASGGASWAWTAPMSTSSPASA